MCSPPLTCAPVPSVCVLVHVGFFFFFLPTTQRKMSSLRRRVCVLICLVSVLITLIMRPSGVCCLCHCLPGSRSKRPQPALLSPGRLCLCACTCASVDVVGRDDGERYQGRFRHAGAQRGARRLGESGRSARGGRRHLGHQRRDDL